MGFVADAISSVASAIGNVVKAVVNVVAKAVSSVINFVLQPFLGLFGMPQVPDASAMAAKQDGVLVQRQGSNAAIPVVYGLRKVGSIVTYAETGSDNNQYLWVAHVLCEGPIEGLYEVFINDYQLSNDTIAKLNASDGAVVEVNDGKFNGRCQMQFFKGEYFADPKLSSTVGLTSILKDAPSWKPDMVYNGMAVIFARYYWKKIETQADSDNNPFTGSIPEVKTTVLGKKVASLVIASPDGYTYDNAPIRYSTNPAEILLDYLRNPRYGKGLKNTDIDWTTWKQSCAKCNTEVTYLTGNGIKGPIMTCNTVVDTGATIFQNVKTLLMGFRAYMPYVQGKYKLRIEDAGNATDITSGVATIVATFTPDNIQGNVTFTGIDKSAKYNQIALTYVDPDNKYSTQQVIYPETEAERQTYIDMDGGRENKQEVTFPTITNYAMAKDFARLLFNKSRRQESCSLTVTSQGLELEPGDCIRIQSNILNFSSDPWRVISVKINDNMTVDLGCVRNPDDIYPYVRVGEEDVVLPVYVPKGASIYYPSSTNKPPIGLVPPTRVPLVGTNPNTSAGGGVGAPNGSVNTTPVVNPPVVVAPPLSDYVNITKVTYRRDATNIVYATLEFNQPFNAMYEATDLWYKGQGDLGYKKISITDKPGAGLKISYVLGPLIARQYQVITRVRYSTGESSEKIGSAALGAEFLTQEDPTDYISTVTSGWSLPPFVYIPARNNLPQYVLASRPGTGTPPARSLVLSVRQNTATTTAEQPNYDINGLKIYWKPSAGAYWKEKSYLFPATYIPGDVVTLNFNEDIGETGDPETYDFIARFTYIDGTESSKQWRYMSVPVQTGNSYNVFIDSKPDLIFEDSGAYTLDKLADHPEAVVNPLDITVGISYVFSSGNGTVGHGDLRVGVIPPNASNLVYWRGLRLYSRTLDPFTTPQAANNGWTLVDQLNLTLDPEGNVSIVKDTETDPKEYEYLLVPLVRSGTSNVETTNGWYFKGKVKNNNPITGIANVITSLYGSRPNFKDLLSPQLKLVSTVLNSTRPLTLTPDPIVDVNLWYLIDQGSKAKSAWNQGTASENRLGALYQLVINVGSVGATCQDVIIYRRTRYVNTTTFTNPAQNLVGHWEKTVVTTGATTNNILLYLRPPVSRAEYSATAFGVTDPAYSTYKPVASPSKYDEFIIQVRQTGSTASAYGVYLKGSARVNQSSWDLLQYVPGNNVKVKISDYNVAVDTARQIDQAYTSPTAANLIAVSIPGEGTDSPTLANTVGISYYPSGMTPTPI